MKNCRLGKDIFVLLILLIIVRGWVVITALEEVTANDELDTGLLAAQLLGPKVLPFHESWNPRIGASAVYQILAIPFYLIFGYGLISLKVMSLFIGAVILVLLYKVVLRYGDRGTALWAALFFIFAPPSYVKISLFALGAYYASFLFTLLAAYLFLQLIGSEKERDRNRDSFLLGAVLGFAIFFNHISIITLICIIFLFLAHYPISRRNLRIFTTGFLGLMTGILPLMIMLYVCGFERAVSIYGKRLWDYAVFDIPTALSRLMKLLVFDFPASLRFHTVGPIPDWLLTWTWYGLAGISVIGSVVLNRSKLTLLLRGILPAIRWKAPKEAVTLEIFVLVFIGIFLIGYAFTSFQLEPWHDTGYRYLMIIYPAIFILIAIQIGRLSRKMSTSATLVGAIVIIPCLVALAWPAAIQTPLRILHYDGLSFHGLAPNAVVIWKDNIGENLQHSIAEMNQLQRSAFLMSFGNVYSASTSLEQALRLAQKSLSLEDRIHFYRGMGFLRQKAHIKQPEHLLSIIPQLVETEHRHILYEWLSDGIVHWHMAPKTLNLLLNMASRTEEKEYHDLLLEAIGASIVSGEQETIQNIHNELSTLLKNDPEKKAWVGVGAKFASVYGYDFTLSQEILNSISDPLVKRQFICGIACAMRNDPGVALKPWRWVDKVSKKIPHNLRDIFLINIGIATQKYPDRSPYWLAYEIKQVLHEKDRVSICEGIGCGVARYSKTFNDYLRWFINWDHYMGPGCSEAFRCGFIKELQEIYRGSPGIIRLLTERLRLKEKLEA